MIVLINVLIRRLVVGPVLKMSDLAQHMRGDHIELAAASRHIDGLNTVAIRADELGESARALQQMAREVCEREELLRQQVQSLRIEIDQTRKEREVSEIVQSDTFQRMRDWAARRRRPEEGEPPGKPPDSS